MVAGLVALGASLVGVPASAQDDGGSVARRHRRHRDHVQVDCPLSLDDPGLVLARVGDTVLTACDLAVARVQRERAGLTGHDLPRILRELVDDALLAEEARARGLTSPSAARALAEALIRREARAALELRRPDDATVERHIREHPEMGVREERVHLRHLVFTTEAEAHAVITALREGARFEDFLSRSIDPLAARDAGDLGLLTPAGATGVPRAVLEAGLSLTTDGAVAEEPVRGFMELQDTSQRSARRRSRRARRVEVWHVVQRLERVPEERLPDAELRARAALRLLRERYVSARNAARAMLATEAARRASASILEAVLARVRLRLP